MKELLKFEADWCSQCKALTPTLSNVIKEFPDVLLTRVDCEIEEAKVEKYQVRSMPTLVYLIDNIEIGRLTGAVPADKIRKLLNKES
jgi:thioredoxin-like negative regulator of GroEL